MFRKVSVGRGEQKANSELSKCTNLSRTQIARSDTKRLLTARSHVHAAILTLQAEYFLLSGLPGKICAHIPERA